MRTTPTSALETVLSLGPIDLFTKESAAISALRLKEGKNWKGGHLGYKIIMNYVASNIQTDYTLPFNDFNPVALTDFPTRELWESNRVIIADHVSVFTDGSKTDLGVGSGIFSDNPPINKSLKLPDFCSVFQAEVFAVCEAANILSALNLKNKNIDIFIDSHQAAIKAISSIVTKSKLVDHFRNTLRSLNITNIVTLRWVPGHRDIQGNERADELAKTGSRLDPCQTVPWVLMPMEHEKSRIKQSFLNSANDRWSALETCRVSRNLWPTISKNKTETILKLSRPQLSLLIGILTGHNSMGTHMSRMGIVSSDLCRGCQDEEAEEGSYHFLCECPSLAKSRKTTLGDYFFDELDDVSSLPLKNIMKFIQISGWFREAPNTNSNT
ncbi:uncharacterized protein LOC129908227 [Episyrphus balteatus]|uniref:uncharacterized protein LOC129908227 n=1 Tax=Episyrphus balteatus TaxID=286459 RepID=UPI002485ADA8|nr:uncharacterized protein LOC129908227 [Episyrphus balteatus]